MTIERGFAHRRIVGEYRNDALDAARTNVLISKPEQNSMSPWSQETMAEIRTRKGKGATVNVDEFVDAHAPKIGAGLRSVANEADQITRRAVEAMPNSELKARLLEIVPADLPNERGANARASVVNDSVKPIQGVLDALDDLENPQHITAIALGAHETEEDALAALLREQRIEGLTHVPVRSGTGLQTLLRAIDQISSRAEELQLGTETERVAVAGVRDAVDTQFGDLAALSLYTAQDRSTFWITDYNVLLGRTIDGEYLALVHSSAFEN